ncbi:hypothetical protein TW85_19930 [Marinomonas sp. S3726]|uniref:NACHT domain-containing protein n=1 Tax=Marinomonas sp. S3726 TaxID=579484 RepID=UPI0005FA6E2B|nr:NACHT domain-containing protein [Marinomonas sp. S3726]KJZ10519.1 hypothetical protein TW85_19930 [Marinomonas sp. S3726]
MKEVDPNKIFAEVVKLFSKPVFDGAKLATKDIYEKLKVNIGFCFSKYLERNYVKYSKTKTVLYRGAPVNLKDFYIRTNLSVNDVEVDEADFLKKIEKNKKLIVSGAAGTGKSTFCKSLFVDLIESPNGIFPIFIELRHLNNRKNINLIDYIIETMILIDPSFSKSQLEYAIRLGKVLLILDGFDELNGEYRSDFEKEIVSLSNSYHNIMMILSSRPDSRFDSWDEFYKYKVLPLDKEKAKNLIHKLDYDRKVKNSFLTSLDEELYEKHKSFAQNPLLLTMMLLTYEQIAEIPNKIHLFYEQAFLTLFNKHDSLKSLYKRKSFSGLPLDDFKRLLSSFCILSYSKKLYYFEEEEILKFLDDAIKLSSVDTCRNKFLEDLLNSVCIMQKDGLGYTFTHRSFQEYFTALYLINMSKKNKFDVFERISGLNFFDSVMHLAFDMNSELIEQEWIIPKIIKSKDKVESDKNETSSDFNVISKMISSVFLMDDDSVNLSFSLRGSMQSEYLFIRFVHSIYGSEYSSFIRLKNGVDKDLSKEKNIELENKIIREIKKTKEKSIDLKLNNLGLISDDLKECLSTYGSLKRICAKYYFMDYILLKLNKKYESKEVELSELLLCD